MWTVVEQALDHLVGEGIVEPVDYVDWPSPINVLMLKPDVHSVRIWSDYKVQNEACKLGKYTHSQKWWFVCLCCRWNRFFIIRSWSSISTGTFCRRYLVIWYSSWTQQLLWQPHSCWYCHVIDFQNLLFGTMVLSLLKWVCSAMSNKWYTTCQGSTSSQLIKGLGWMCHPNI